MSRICSRSSLPVLIVLSFCFSYFSAFATSVAGDANWDAATDGMREITHWENVLIELLKALSILVGERSWRGGLVFTTSKL